ncbi:MAG: glycosyltransferase family 2 protein [Bacteroidota bacterium]
MNLNSRISGVIITYNESANIERCIKSLEGVVDEVVVVDSNSTDDTAAICKELGAKVILQPFLGYIEQKNFAMECAEYDYVLSLDADEALSEQLKSEIATLKQDLKYSAYRFNRLNNYCGKWLKHGHWYPDRKIRLWDKSKYRWAGTNPHDKVDVQDKSQVKSVNADILHYSYATVSDHIDQVNKFARIHAKSAAKIGKRASLLIHVSLNPFFKFVKRYFLYLGFLDGYYGFIAAVNSAMLNYLKYVYLREINKKELN